MTKAIAIILSFVFFLSFCSCKNQPQIEESPPIVSETPLEEKTTAISEEPLLEPSPDAPPAEKEDPSVPETPLNETDSPVAFTITGTPLNDSTADDYLNINNQNNVQNAACFIEQGGWIYGPAWASNGSPLFVKVRIDGSDWTVLDSGYPQDIFIIENYLYYTLSSNTECGLYRIRTSGEDRLKIVDSVSSMQIVDTQIYYTSPGGDVEFIETEAGYNIVPPEYSH